MVLDMNAPRFRLSWQTARPHTHSPWAGASQLIHCIEAALSREITVRVGMRSAPIPCHPHNRARSLENFYLIDNFSRCDWGSVLQAGSICPTWALYTSRRPAYPLPQSVVSAEKLKQSPRRFLASP